MHTFLVALAVIVSVALIVFFAVKLYKHEVAREKAIQAQRAARRAEEDAIWDRIEQDMETSAANWGKVHAGLGEMKAQVEEAARIKRQRANQDKAFLSKRG